MTRQNGFPVSASTANQAVTRLVELARKASSDALTPEEDAGVYRLERSVIKSAAPIARVAYGVGWLAALAVVGTAAGVYVRRERAITFEVVSGKVSDGYISSGTTDAVVRFSDNSGLGLDPGTRLRISDLDVRGARVMLEGGLLHVRIQPRPHGSWTLGAGPYTVHVTGTDFDLAWHVEQQTLDLRLRQGSVIVEGPLADAGLRVGAGQHLVADVSAGSLSLVDELNSGTWSTPAPSIRAAAVPTAIAVPAASGLSSPGHPPPVSSARIVGTAAIARADEESWGARVARGDFSGVVADAERRGIDKMFAESSANDLAALADAARYARRPEIARRALMAQRTRYPGSVQALDAPFFLGGLAEGQRNEGAALEWYEVYLRESAKGVYASQALGRKMMLVQRAQRFDGARDLAVEYLVRFPDGPYAPSARKLLQSQ